MKNYLCWSPTGVTAVVNTEAEAVSPAIFRAVHSDCTLQVSPPMGTAFQDLAPSHFTGMSQEDLLREFLRPEVNYSRLAVYGRSGSGKSHLIHWLKLNIPKSEDRLVLVIPKAGTSLRSIIEMIIEQLVPDRQISFREVLERTGDATATRAGQKERLLNEIAYAIGEKVPLPGSPDLDLERELIKVLPYLFQDVYFRQKHFLRDGNVISELVDHVFAAPTAYRPADERRRFTSDDLPVDPRDFGQAAKLAQQALHYLYGVPEALQMAVTIINDCLNSAIMRTLSFSGDRLIGLMADLRRQLFSEGRELILLIEDFARLQGLDRALLQAMIEQGDSENRLCRLRWAIAVTTGFFEQVVETVYTRMSFLVDMDKSVGRQASGRMDRSSLAAFAGPYLNAVRLGLGRLEEWDSVGSASPLPNACEECSFMSSCHDAFGATTMGHGLYPFTSTALWNMTERADERMQEAFNPRALQTNVLVKVLDNHGPSLASGHFPPSALLDELGGFQHLSATTRDSLRRRMPGEEGRLGALLELWDGSGAILNLPPDILDAFSAPEIPDAAEREEQKETADEPGPLRDQPAPDMRTRDERELEAWATGDTLKNAADKLRPLLFDAIADSIDWDGLGLERSTFCGADSPRPFRRRSVVFTRQSTAAINSLVSVEIPGANASAAEFDRTALALQGLLRAQRDGTWDFQGGSQALAAFLQCLSAWRDDVIGQIRNLTAATADWSHAMAAAELLAVAAALNGKIKADAELTSDVAALFTAEWPEEIQAVSDDLRRVYGTLYTGRNGLIDVLRAFCSGSKGGEVGTLVDPAVPIAALKRVRAEGWRLTLKPPSDINFDLLRKAADLYRKTAAALEPAANVERADRLSWLSEMEAAFGPEAKKLTIVTTLADVRTSLVATGLAGRSAGKLEETLGRFDGVQFDDAVSASRILRDAPDAVGMICAFARGRRGAVIAARELVAATQAFLDQSETILREQADQQSAQEQAVATDIQRIETSLDVISNQLRMFEVEHAT
ncbi:MULTISPECIES: protein DpdH [Mesorhizobium]|uniref:protein DpdH n=1 Tax=Mesorhizobium TaxID=68287 RepID=UPI0010A95D15|nr:MULTISPECIES: protein DpdH [Mesorhizobium]